MKGEGMKVVKYLVLLIVSSISTGFALVLMWNWFVIGITGVELNLPTAIGLMYIASILKGKKGSKELTGDQIAALLISPWVAVLCGLVVTLFM